MIEGLGLAQIKSEGMCSSYEGNSKEWNPLTDQLNEHLKELDGLWGWLFKPVAKRAWCKALKENAK